MGLLALSESFGACKWESASRLMLLDPDLQVRLKPLKNSASGLPRVKFLSRLNVSKVLVFLYKKWIFCSPSNQCLQTSRALGQHSLPFLMTSFAGP